MEDTSNRKRAGKPALPIKIKRWNMKQYKHITYNILTGEVIMSTHKIKTHGKGWIFSSKHPQISNLKIWLKEQEG